MGAQLQNLRVVRAAALQDYQFELARLNKANARPSGLALGEYLKDYVLYHAWKPGHLDLSKAEARALDRLHDRIADLGWSEDESLDLDQLTSKIFSTFQTIQNGEELKRFLGWVHDRRPKTVVEIGSAGGGLLYGLCQVSDPEGALISIDIGTLPGELFSSFAGPRQTLHLIQGDSRAYETRERLKALLRGRPIDLLFIDGDHSYGAVKSDFSMYAPLVAEGGHVALHDINVSPENFGPGMEVALFWKEIQRELKTETIVGPTVVAPKSWDQVPWGIGIVSK